MRFDLVDRRGVPISMVLTGDGVGIGDTVTGSGSGSGAGGGLAIESGWSYVRAEEEGEKEKKRKARKKEEEEEKGGLLQMGASPASPASPGGIDIPFYMAAPGGKLRILSPKTGELVRGDTVVVHYAIEGNFTLPEHGYLLLSINKGSTQGKFERLFPHGGPVTLLKLDPGVVTIDVMLVDPKLFPVPDPTARKNATWPPKYVMMVIIMV